MKTEITKDLKNKRVLIEREFNASLENVWNAWTKSELLEQWWAPKPWKAKTKTMNFAEGGHWLYAMVGPDGEEMWAIIDFLKISKLKMFEAMDFFCDANGNKSSEFGNMNWKYDFIPSEKGKKVQVEISFEKEEDIQKIIEMGFEEGFASAHDNLDALLAKK